MWTKFFVVSAEAIRQYVDIDYQQTVELCDQHEIDLQT